MPTAMEFAINTIVKLCEENAKLRYKVIGDAMPMMVDDDTEVVLSEEHPHTPTISASEFQCLKDSADMIAEAQEKRIILGEIKYKQNLEEKENEILAIKVQNDFLSNQIKELTESMMETKAKLNKCVGSSAGCAIGRPRKPTHSSHSVLLNHLVSEVSPSTSTLEPQLYAEPYEHPHP